jgi:hypothetical protein
MLPKYYLIPGLKNIFIMPVFALEKEALHMQKSARERES